MIQASHPAPAVAVTCVAAVLAVGVGHPAGPTVRVAAMVLASQLAVGWANDAIDARRDRAVRRADKPVAVGDVSRRAVALAAGVAALVTVALATTHPWPATAVALLGLGSALLYDWPLKLTVASALPYLVSFAALPTFVLLSAPAPIPPPVWLIVGGGLLGAGAHFANALPDLAEDTRVGVRGLPQRLGVAGSQGVAAALLLAATASLVLGPAGAPTGPALAAAAAALFALPAGWLADRRAHRLGRRRVTAFRAVMALAVVDVALLVGEVAALRG
ncbi:hypothetical protein GCM10010201_15440 [Pilimelia columellifera subsp. columellifera]|uniref:4-hydroxybenzoate polyprenyltransferase n=2 Tax=Pilimelia TaxID=53370 RepID=A0ABN3ND24_9ACTN